MRGPGGFDAESAIHPTGVERDSVSLVYTVTAGWLDVLGASRLLGRQHIARHGGHDNLPVPRVADMSKADELWTASVEPEDREKRGTRPPVESDRQAESWRLVGPSVAPFRAGGVW